MAKKVQKPRPLKAIQWQDADWLWLAEVSKSLGLTRSDFVRRAALAAAEATANGMTPYFVRGGETPPQNMGANFFQDRKGLQKTIPGGDRGASAGRGAIAKQRPTPARNAVKGRG